MSGPARVTLKLSEPILFIIISFSLHPVNIQVLLHLAQISVITQPHISPYLLKLVLFSPNICLQLHLLIKDTSLI